MSNDDFWFQADKLFGEGRDTLGIPSAPAMIDLKIAPVHPAQFAQPLVQRRSHRLRFHIALTDVRKHAEAAHLLALLRSYANRPRRRATEQCDELAAPDHSITSSARASSICGTSSPSALAVLRLMTSSYLVGACTGRSAGFSPLRMRSTYVAARRKLSVRSTP